MNIKKEKCKKDLYGIKQTGRGREWREGFTSFSLSLVVVVTWKRIYELVEVVRERWGVRGEEEEGEEVRQKENVECFLLLSKLQFVVGGWNTKKKGGFKILGFVRDFWGFEEVKGVFVCVVSNVNERLFCPSYPFVRMMIRRVRRVEKRGWWRVKRGGKKRKKSNF